jgi:hypothetical protein
MFTDISEERIATIYKVNDKADNKRHNASMPDRTA